MRRSHYLAAAACLAAIGLSSLVAAQDNRTAPAAPPSPGAAPPPAAQVTTAVPNTPVAKGLATAVTPDEGAPPPASEQKPVARLAKPPEPPKPPAEPMKRARYDSAVLQAVDKITAETLRFESKVGEPVRYKGLIVTVRSCETTAPDEAESDSMAYLDVQSQPISAPGHAAAPPRAVFRGWMFASSPSLHPFEHPIYDLWLIACKTAAPPPPAPSAPKSPAAPARAPARRT